MRDPVQRDNRAYRLLGLMVLVGALTIALLGGLSLKQQRKVYRPMLNSQGCYLWSDGYRQCKRPVPVRYVSIKVA